MIAFPDIGVSTLQFALAHLYSQAHRRDQFSVVWVGRILDDSVGCARAHHFGRPKVNHALTFTQNHPGKVP